MHKSSPLTFIFKYIFPAFMIVGMIYGNLMTWTEGSPESQRFAMATLIASLWASIFIVQMPFRLKYIRTSETGIIIKTRGIEKLVYYKDIEWVAKFDFTSPFFMTLKYHDNEDGLYKKISYMPSQNDQTIFGSDEMTKYIKEKISTENPEYSKESQPSTIKNFLRTTLIGLPFFILIFYYMR